MNELQHLLNLVISGKLNRDKLNELLTASVAQLSRYDQALILLNQATGQRWTYEIYKEVLQFGSGGQTSTVTRSEWDSMFPDAMLRTRQTTLDSVLQGQKAFQEVKAAIQSELEKQKPHTENHECEVTFSCPHCTQHLTIHESYRGDQIPCPTCNEQITVPPLAVPPPLPSQVPTSGQVKDGYKLDASGSVTSSDTGLDVGTNVDYLEALKKLGDAIRFLDRCGRLDDKNLKDLHKLLGSYAEPARLVISEIHSQLTRQHLEDLRGRKVSLPTDDLDQLKIILRKLFYMTFEDLKSHFIEIIKMQALTSESARAGLPLLEKLTPESMFAAS